MCSPELKVPPTEGKLIIVKCYWDVILHKIGGVAQVPWIITGVPIPRIMALQGRP